MEAAQYFIFPMFLKSMGGVINRDDPIKNPTQFLTEFRIRDSIRIGGRRIKFQTQGKVKKNSFPRAKPEGRNFLTFPRVWNLILRPPIRMESNSYTLSDQRLVLL